MDSNRDMSLGTDDIKMIPVEGITADLMNEMLTAVVDSNMDQLSKPADSEMIPVEAITADLMNEMLTAVVDSNMDQPSKPADSEMTPVEAVPADLMNVILSAVGDSKKEQPARSEEAEMTTVEAITADLMDVMLSAVVGSNKNQSSMPEEAEMIPITAAPAKKIDENLSAVVESNKDLPSNSQKAKEAEMTFVENVPADLNNDNPFDAASLFEDTHDVSRLINSMASLEVKTNSIPLGETNKQNDEKTKSTKEPHVSDPSFNDGSVLKVPNPSCCEEDTSDENDYDELSTILLSIPSNHDFICSPEGNLRHEETDEFSEEGFDEEESTRSVRCERSEAHPRSSHILSNVDVSPTGAKIERVMIPTNSVLETPTYDMVFDYGSEKIAQFSAESNQQGYGYCDVENVFAYDNANSVISYEPANSASFNTNEYNCFERTSSQINGNVQPYEPEPSNNCLPKVQTGLSTDGNQGSNHVGNEEYIVSNTPMYNVLLEPLSASHDSCSHMVNTACFGPNTLGSDDSAFDYSTDEENILMKLSKERVNNEIDCYMDREKRFGSQDVIDDLETSLGLPSSKSVNPDSVNSLREDVTDGYAMEKRFAPAERGRNGQRTIQKRRYDSEEGPYMLALQPKEKVEICNISNDVYQINVIPHAGTSKLRRTEVPFALTHASTSPTSGFVEGRSTPISFTVSNRVPSATPPYLSPQSSPSIIVLSSDDEASCDPPYLSPQVQTENIEQVNLSSDYRYNSAPQYYVSQDPPASSSDVTHENMASENLSSNYGHGSDLQYYSYEDPAISASHSPENAMLAHLPSCNYDFTFGSTSVQHNVSLQTQAVSTASSFNENNGQMSIHSFHQEWSTTSSFITSQNPSTLPNNMYEGGNVASNYPINYCEPQPDNYPSSHDLSAPTISTQYTSTQPAVEHLVQPSYPHNESSRNPSRENYTAVVTDASGKTYKPRKSYTQRRPALAIVDGSPTFFMRNNNKVRSYSLPTSEPVPYARNTRSRDYRSAPYPQQHVWNPNESPALSSARPSHYENSMPINQFNEYSPPVMNTPYDYNQQSSCDVFNQVDGPYSVNDYEASAPFYNNTMIGNVESATDYNMR